MVSAPGTASHNGNIEAINLGRTTGMDALVNDEDSRMIPITVAAIVGILVIATILYLMDEREERKR